MATAQQTISSTRDSQEYLAICEALAEQAKTTVNELLEARASKFAQCPSQLETIERGLSRLSPHKMRARLIELIDAEFSTPRHNFGFSGCIPLMNLSGAEMYATRLCKIAEQHL